MTLARSSLLLLLVLASPAVAQPRKDAHVIYKDGFVVKGKVKEKSDILYDSESGRPFVIPKGDFHIDDYVRRIYFSPSNVQKVFQYKPGDIKEPVKVVRFDKVFQNLKIRDYFQFGTIPPWDETAERTVQVTFAPNGRIEMRQRIGIISSQYVTAVTDDYPWNMAYFTSEFKPDLLRKIMVRWLDELKAYKQLPEPQKYLLIANFMHEAGWQDQAEAELIRIMSAFPKDRKTAEEVLAKVKSHRANAFVEAIDRRSKLGQHLEAIDQLDNYDRLKYQDLVTADNRIKALDLRQKYDKAKVDIEEAKTHLAKFATLLRAYPPWKSAAEFMTAELNYDTFERLDLFLQFAQQYDLDVKANRKPGQKAEEVMALAVSGWLQGAKAAEADPKTALKLLDAREFILDYLRNDNQPKRVNEFSGFKRKNDLPIDVIARLVKMIPPASPHDAKLLHNDVQTVKIELPDSDGGSYLLQLPPGYHHQRAYPVAVLLQSPRYPADEMIKQFSADAAKHGFILAAPLWAGKGGRKYGHTATEHALVLDTIRDLRRRLQVDSDRVCLFGWEDGGTYAFDVGLGHPDQFAGVVPMNGSLTPFTRRYYWPNAQYLPFYVIEGERNGASARLMKDLYKEWTRPPYTCFYVEYQGRGAEWYAPEIEKMMDWMSRKRRHHPMRQMGRPNFNTTLGEEFHSSRDCDNRFYWLRCESINAKNQSGHAINFDIRFMPATFQGDVSVGNKDSSSGAKIWNQANLRVHGTKHFSFWISPTMMNLDHPLKLIVNSQQVGGMRQIVPSVETMLEELYQTGDRQRLFIAKIDVKVGA